jgi:hypothetical protein
MPTTPSGLADTSIINGYVNNARDTASQALTGAADAGVTVLVYDGTSQLGSVVADESGAWSYTLGRLLDGTHRLTAVAMDAGGHLSAASDVLTFKVDTRPPSKPGGLADASISQGLVNAAHDTADQALTGRTDAGAHVAIYDGTTQIGTVTAGSTGAWSFTLGQLSEGAHKLSATATDNVGNTSAASDVLSFTVDTKAPGAPTALDDAKIINGYVNAGHDVANQTLKGEAEAYSFVSVYDGATKLGVVQASGDGFWSYTLGKLADGDHSFTATAADKAGNTGPASTALAFTVDTQAPPVSIVHVGDFPGAPLGYLDIAGDSETGATITLSEGSTKLASGFVFDGTTWDVALPPVANGQHAFAVAATDPAGNRTTTSLLYNQGATSEHGPTVKLNGLANPADTIVDLPAELPAGVTYDPATHSFTLDPGVAAYQNMTPIDTVTVVVEYSVTHGATTTPAAVAWLVSGPDAYFLDGDVHLSGSAVAASQTLDDGSVNYGTVVGDVRSLAGQAQGGDDVISLFQGAQTTVIGDAFSITDQAHGGDDDLFVVGLPTVTAIGDARTLSGDGVGGNDTITAGADTSFAIGDAKSLSDHARGGDDLVQALARSHGADTFAYGDGETMSGHAIGGDDTVAGTTAYGDAGALADYAQGGNDVVSGVFELSHQGDDKLYGDGATLSGHAQGGDDTVTGGTAYGDARTLTDEAKGGDDLLTGGASGGFPPPIGYNQLYGDGLELLGHAQGGNDTLVAGSYANLMWGDAQTVAATATTGADLFVFQPMDDVSGHHQIMDFQPGKDRIEFEGFGFTGFADLSSHFQDTSDGLLITFAADHDVRVRGVTGAQLTAGDFVLA